MNTREELKRELDGIHRKGYPAYKSLKGQYDFHSYVLSIDHVQGDPFAAPSKLRVTVDEKKAGFPGALFDAPHKKTALEDYLLRIFYSKIKPVSFQASGSGKSGLISVSRPGQEILERTACHIGSGFLELRFEVGFPANGRSINSIELKKILFDLIPPCVEASLYFKCLKEPEVWECIHLAEDQHYIRKELKRLGLTAFVANGSILPRESGVSAKPLKHAVPFVSPASMEHTLSLPHKGPLKGMGIPEGITLIVGGGYHGKSTLLKALELGVYNHMKGDGREYVITDDTAVKLRAEDGRSIESVNISTFINHLPNKKDTMCFSTEDASGSTSQAANTIEAIEAGSSLFLIDEDTSATNFMVRDQLMMEVIQREMEPITPFHEVVRSLYEKRGISTILVAGSSGAYFFTADKVIQMDSYEPFDITEKVQAILKGHKAPDECSLNPRLSLQFSRVLKKQKQEGDRQPCKIKIFGKDSFQINKETVDLRYVEQLTDSEQTAALGYCLKYLLEQADGKKELSQLIESLYLDIEKKGLSTLFDSSFSSCPLAKPRKQEIFFCVNRYRKLFMEANRRTL